MNKSDIDKWFKNNDREILKIIDYYKFLNKKNFNKGDMFSDVYIFIIELDKDITSESVLESIVYNYIKMNSYWTNNSINRDYKLPKEFNSTVDTEDVIYDVIYDEDESDLDNKLLIEKRIDILLEFRDTLDDLEERIFFTRYVCLLSDGVRPTVRLMMNEFGLKLNMTHNFMKNLLERLNEYIIKNNYYNNKK